jgi:RimJ/RimL family protein N-acetyltransferase
MNPTVRIDRPATGPLVFRPLDAARDAALLHRWVNQPHARFWNQQGKSQGEIESIYRELLERGQDLRLACREDTGEPLLLLWLYDPRHDVLGQRYAVQPGDRGLHVFLAPVDRAVSGMAYQLLSAALEVAFAEPWVQRIVAEPDLRNDKVITRFLQVGFQREGVVHLPNKNALLLSFNRQRLRAGFVSPPPRRPALRAWGAQVRWHIEKGRVLRAWWRLLRSG